MVHVDYMSRYHQCHLFIKWKIKSLEAYKLAWFPLHRGKLLPQRFLPDVNILRDRFWRTLKACHPLRLSVYNCLKTPCSLQYKLLENFCPFVLTKRLKYISIFNIAFPPKRSTQVHQSINTINISLSNNLFLINLKFTFSHHELLF